MILEIDHIAISSMNFHDDIEFFKSMGYELKFIESNVDNLMIKHSLLHNYQSTHDIALLTLTDNLGIELVNHKTIHKSNEYVVPIFENVDSNLFLNQEKNANMIGTQLKMKLMEIPAYVSNNKQDSPFHFTKFVVMVDDIEKSAQFWKLLGFKIIKIMPEFTLLEFKALFNKNTYHLYLQKIENNKEHYLDDTGFNCVALISNNSVSDKKTLDDNGVTVTDVQKLTIGNKTLDIFFAIGPSNELVEVISTSNSIDKN